MHFQAPFLDREFTFKSSRSGGKGGQNVNKVSSKVLLEFHIAGSILLSDEEKNILLEKLQDRLSKEGKIQITVQAERSQLLNREAAIKKMYALLNKCFIKPKKRKASKPSKASVEKRLSGKKRHSSIKQLRQKRDSSHYE